MANFTSWAVFAFLVIFLYLHWRIVKTYTKATVFTPLGLFYSSIALVLLIRPTYYLLFAEQAMSLLSIFKGRDYFEDNSLQFALVASIAILFTTVGSIAGYTLSSSKESRFFYSVTTKTRLLKTGLPLVIIGILAVLVYTLTSGVSFHDLLSNPDDRGEFSGGKGYLEGVARFLTTGTIVLFSAFCIAKNKNILYLAILLLVMNGVFLGVFGQRSRIILPIVSFIILYDAMHTRVAVFSLLKIVLSLFLLSFVFLIFRRYSGSNVQDFWTFYQGLVDSASGSYLLMTQIFSTFDSLFVSVTNQSPYLLGNSYNVFIQFMPSSILQNKQDLYATAGQVVVSENFPSIRGGIPPTFIGEAWINFGYTGVITITSLFGACIGYYHKYYLANCHRFIPALILAAIAPTIFLSVWGASNIWVQGIFKEMIAIAFFIFIAKINNSLVLKENNMHRTHQKTKKRKHQQ